MIPSLMPAQRLALGEVSEFYRVPAIAGGNQPRRVRFGLLADPQYADAEPDARNNRHYRRSLDKLADAVAELNRRDLDFVVTLGDLVDRDWSAFADILPLYRQLRHPHLTVMGNHDADVVSRHLYAQRPPLGLPKHYFQFAVAGYRFIAIDGNDLSLYCNPANGDEYQQAQRMLAETLAAGQPQAQPWNGALGAAQLRWLEQALQGAADRQEIIIVLGHYPLAPRNKHNLWNNEPVVQLLRRYRARAYFGGHQHGGGYQRIDHTDFITLKGMVDGADGVPFAVAELSGAELILTGFGPQESLALK
ncbi:metallophosphoesterase [Sodalis sp. RH21]|uniref:metallophosphoesterase n=1 Tax=unclassified Sodalis (in: enterobacteria) TaxID=2636512 RepID=UPI0039B4DA63